MSDEKPETPTSWREMAKKFKATRPALGHHEHALVTMALLEEWGVDPAAASSTYVEVERTITFQGDAASVAIQMARSLPAGWDGSPILAVTSGRTVVGTAQDLEIWAGREPARRASAIKRGRDTLLDARAKLAAWAARKGVVLP